MGRHPLTTRGCLYERGRGVELRLGIENMITNKKYSKTGFSWTNSIRWTLSGEHDGLCQYNSVYSRPRRKKAGWLGVWVIQAIEQGYYFRIEEMGFTMLMTELNYFILWWALSFLVKVLASQEWCYSLSLVTIRVIFWEIEGWVLQNWFSLFLSIYSFAR